jgi:hypothetical protein
MRDVSHLVQFFLTIGRFIWAKLILEQIRSIKVQSVAAINEILTTLPPTLEGVYDKIFQKLNSQCATDKAVARHVITWLQYSDSPMSLGELVTMFTVDWKNQVIDESRKPLDPVGFLHVCENLVIFDKLLEKNDKLDIFGMPIIISPECLIVKFVHSSLREYIQRRTNSTLQDKCGSLLSCRSNGYMDLSMTCITYLRLRLPRPKTHAEVLGDATLSQNQSTPTEKGTYILVH